MRKKAEKREKNNCGIHNPLGCMVPWLAAPGNPELCKGTIPIVQETRAQLGWFITNIYEQGYGFSTMPNSPACKKPCTQTKANSKLKKSENSSFGAQWIFLQFKKTVKV